MIKTLHEKAVLVKLVQHSWSGRKVDPKVGEHAAKSFEAKSARIGRYYKQTFPKEDLADAAEIRRKAYTYHMTNTLPWMDGGVRMTPVTELQSYLDFMRKCETEHQAAVNKIAKNFADSVKLGMQLQGKMANIADYPTAESIKSRFGLETIVMQLPSTTDWRIDVPKQQLTELKAEAERDMQRLQQDALRDLWQRLSEEVGHVQERLNKDDAVFRNSLFENIKEVVSVVAKLNFANDTQLEAMRKEVEAKLAKQTPDEVRADQALRKKVAGDAAAIMKKMSTYMSGGKK